MDRNCESYGILTETLLSADALIRERTDLADAIEASLTLLHEKKFGVPIKEYMQRSNIDWDSVPDFDHQVIEGQVLRSARNSSPCSAPTTSPLRRSLTPRVQPRHHLVKVV
jgi:hypothetical protein